MKKLLLIPLILAGLPACETVEDDHAHPRSTTPTTEETTVRQPVSATTETHSIRTY